MILHILSTTAADVAAVLPQQIPDPAPVQPPGTGKIADIMGWVKWLGLAVSIIGLMVAGAMMAFGGRRGEGGEHAGRIGSILAGVIVIGAAAAIVGFIAT